MYTILYYLYLFYTVLYYVRFVTVYTKPLNLPRNVNDGLGTEIMCELIPTKFSVVVFWNTLLAISNKSAQATGGNVNFI